MEESSRLVDTGILITLGGVIGHFFTWLLRFLKLRAEKEERVVDDTFEYANMLRKDMEEIKLEIAALRAENAALKVQIAELSARLEFASKDREHVERCSRP